MDSTDSKRFEVAETLEEPLPTHAVVLPVLNPESSEEGGGEATILERMANKLVGLPRGSSGDPGSPSGSNAQVHDRPSRGFD